MAEKSMTNSDPNYTSKGKIFGIILTIFCSCAFLTTCTVVKLYKLPPAEVCLIRGIVQLTLFLFLYFVSKRKRRKHPISSSRLDEKHVQQTYQEKHWFSWKGVLIVSLCGISFGFMTGLSYIGVKLIPISHFVVFGHTTPVFTLIFSALILRQKITFLKAFLCLTTIIGVALVIQPDFIFSKTDSNVVVFNRSSNTNEIQVHMNQSLSLKKESDYHHLNESMKSRTNEYYIGLTMTFAAALTAGLAMVLSAKAKECCSNNLLMAIIGLCTFIIGALGPLFKLENRFFTNLDTWTPSSNEMSVTIEVFVSIGVAILSLIGIVLLIQASQVCPPIIVSLVRSCEIILGLFLEKMILINLIPEKMNMQDERILSLLIVGALLVLISVSAMSLSDWIQQFFNLCRSTKETNIKNDSSLVEEIEVKLLNEKQI